MNVKSAGCSVGQTSKDELSGRISRRNNYDIVSCIIERPRREPGGFAQLHITLDYLTRSDNIKRSFSASTGLDGKRRTSRNAVRQLQFAVLR